MAIFGGAPKVNVEAEQARLKTAQDKAAREALDTAAASSANRENNLAASASAKQASARAAFMGGITEDSDESRRKFLKKV
jgi:hypothetical protein